MIVHTEHQWFSTETDMVSVRLNNRQPTVDYIHVCLVCGQREATDVYGHLYVATGEPFNGGAELWVEVNPHKP